MDAEIQERVRRIYAAIGAVEERDPRELKAQVISTDKIHGMFQDFRSGLNDDELLNHAHTLIYNIANLRDHLRRWAVRNGKNASDVDNVADISIDLQIIRDLANTDRHGYPPRDKGFSGSAPRLVAINRVMRLETQAKKGSWISMTIGADGIPLFGGDGSAKAVTTGDVVDSDSKRIGDFYEIANKSLKAWEELLVNFGLSSATTH